MLRAFGVLVPWKGEVSGPQRPPLCASLAAPMAANGDALGIRAWENSVGVRVFSGYILLCSAIL